MKNPQMTIDKGNQLNLKIKDNFWNSKRKHIQFDEEKPSASSTIADEEEGVKYR